MRYPPAGWRLLGWQSCSLLVTFQQAVSSSGCSPGIGKTLLRVKSVLLAISPWDRTSGSQLRLQSAFLLFLLFAQALP